MPPNDPLSGFVNAIELMITTALNAGLPLSLEYIASALAIQSAMSGDFKSKAFFINELRKEGYPEEGFRPGDPNAQDNINAISLAGESGGVPKNITQKATTSISEKVFQRTARFFDVRTPEKFLDDFETGFRTYLRGEVTSGNISSQDAIFAVLNMDQFQGEYLAELGTRAARGEDIFELTGLSGEQKKVGERIGAAIDTRTTRTTKQQQETTADGGPTSTTKGELKENISEQFTQIEDIRERPGIEQIAKLSPMDFLTERFGKSLGTFIRATKGQRQRAIETSRGPEDVGARRI